MNREKCVFHQSSIKFLGYLVKQEDIHADREKTEAILQMKAPENVKAELVKPAVLATYNLEAPTT